MAGQMSEAATQRAEKRNLLSSFFVTVLIGLAYQEMVTPVRESVRASGITAGTSILMVIFVLVSIRFFIGNQLHLLDEQLIGLPGFVWFYDLMWVIAQCIALIFLGGVCSVEVNQKIHIGFIELLVALYVIDVVWIESQWLLGALMPSWSRPSIPWEWAVVNAALVLAMVLMQRFAADAYATRSLLALLAFNAVAFAIDLFLVDRHKTL